MFRQPTYDEKVLLLRIASGDEQAFTLLFEQYCDAVGNYILRLTKSVPFTEEIVQDIFMKIWLHRDQLPSLDSFQAYLFVVARNHAFNALKQLAKARKHQQSLEQALIAQTSLPVETALTERQELVDKILDLLPPRQKAVIQLGRQQGMKQAEIASRLNISVETVKKHTLLAMRFLKARLRTLHAFPGVFMAALSAIKNSLEVITTFL